MKTASRLSFLLLLAILAACKPTPDPNPLPTKPAAKVEAPPVATPAPEKKPEFPTLVVETFDGGKFDLKDHRGKWVVVNFWATWCNPCLKEIPDLDAMDKARDDVQVIGLAYEEIERADMVAFLKDHPMSYPIAVVDVYEPPADFDTPRGLPMTYLIAPDGKVAARHLGPVTSEELLKDIEASGAKAVPAT